jgi:hypothetical protein
MVEEDGDGIVPSAVAIVQRLEEDVDNGVDDDFSGSEGNARAQGQR